MLHVSKLDRKNDRSHENKRLGLASYLHSVNVE